LLQCRTFALNVRSRSARYLWEAPALKG
jgi:hypothetical protein